ncbi:recombinase family protein [Roseomonas aerophila]|uniref:Recombinase family protein n=1 Tax=Teichococcus aerophilus TaxID=1224513 RepID=A0ABR7RJR4_9PROT|nr:recombinase family protein [Pseudoroseomonas aerophila]
MLVGYARTSTVDQDAGLAAQVRDLEAAGCEKVFAEKVSSVATQRPQLASALDFLREGDTLVIAKPDRLARSTTDLLAIVAKLEAKGVALLVQSMGGEPMSTRGPTGKLMLTMLAAFAEFERALMLERQKEGIAKAKAEGVYKGRAPTARAKAAEVLAMQAQGVPVVEIAKRLEIGVASAFRILRDAKAAAAAETPASLG